MDLTTITSFSQDNELRSPRVSNSGKMMTLETCERNIRERVVELFHFITQIDVLLKIGVHSSLEIQIIASKERVKIDDEGLFRY